MEKLEELVGGLLDDRYRLDAVIGDGATAVVFSAEDTLLSRRVAIKMLRSEAAPDERHTASAARDEEARLINRSAFRREAIAASVLSHPNIVGVYDVSPDTDNPYIVMEYIEGKPLSSHLREGEPLSLDKILYLARAVLEALEDAHDHGIIHRDIKAQNILVTRNGDIKVADFGIAQVAGAGGRILRDKVLGTVDTISPEQASGRRTDRRTDLYSLGVVLYQLATGYLPFRADEPETVAFLHINEPPKFPTTLNPCVAKGLEQVILCAMEKNPADRFADAGAMLTAIARLEEDPDYIFRRFQKKTATRRAPLAALTPATLAILGVLLSLSLCVVLILWSAFSARPEVTVVELPNLVSRTYASLTDELASLDGRITVEIEYRYDVTQAAGTVLAQSHTRIKLDGADDRVTLTLTLATSSPTT